MSSSTRVAAKRLPLKILVLVMAFAFLGGVQAIAATIHTDLWIYQKGDTVTVFGEDFGPVETVDVVTTSPTGALVDAGTAQTDDAGAFTYRFVLDSDEGGIFDVVATGRTSGLTATTQFDPAVMDLSPTSKDFGSVSVGSSASQTFTITNTGTTGMNSIVVALSGTDSSQFSVDTTGMLTTLASGASTTFSVTFAPTTPGAKSASVDVTSNASVDPSAALTGTGANTAPTISDIANQTINEDGDTGALAFTVGDAETAAGSLTLSGSSSDTTLVPNGNIVFGGSGASRTVTVTPAANQNGTATITVTVSDGSLTASDTFLLTVNAVNDAPSFTKGSNQTVAEDAGAQTVVGWATAISAGPSDESGQALTFQVSNDDNGLFSAQPAVASNGTLTYTATADTSGSATVTIGLQDDGGTANGGADTSADQTFTITVNAVNDDPTISDITDQAIDEDTDTGALAFTVGDVETPAGSLTLSGSSSDTTLVPNGNIVFGGSGANRTVTVTPAANQNGTATITVTVTDAGSATASDTFLLTVNAVNDDPDAVDDADSTDEDTPVTVSVLGNDTDGDGDTPSIDAYDGTSVEGGTVLCAVTCTYTPAAGFNGSDSFTYTISDGNGGFDTATVTITVNIVNDDPDAVDDADSTDEDTPVIVDVLGNDTDADGDTVSIDAYDGTSVEGGTVLCAGSCTYTPAPDFNGSDSFTYTIGDGNGGFDTATVTITVDPVNDAPVCADVAISTTEDTPDSTAADCTDADGDSLTYSVTAASDGTSGVSGSDLTYDADPDFSGTDAFTYTANDGTDDSNSADVDVDVTAVNDAPSFTGGADQTVSEDAGAQTVVGWATSISAGPADESGQALTFLVSNDDNGLFSDQPAVAADGTLTYTPAADTSGSATVTVALQDDGGTANGGVDTSADQTFTITVDPVNDAPDAVGDAAATTMNVAIPAIDVLGNDTDADGDTLSIAAFDAASVQGGTVSCAATCSYAPPASYTGTDSFTYTVDDGNGGFDTATVTVTVSAGGGGGGGGQPNGAPRITVTPDHQTVQYSDAITHVSIVGTDPDGGPVTFTASGLPRGVTLTALGNGGASLDGLARSLPGTYIVAVVARDGTGAQSSGQVVITITPEDAVARYTGFHLVFTKRGSASRDVLLRARIADSSTQGSRASGPGDATAGNVSNATVTFMEGDTVLCGPIPVTLDGHGRAIGIARCDERVPLGVGSHDIDVYVEGSHAYASRVGQVEVDRAARNFVSGGGSVAARGAAGELAPDAGSQVSFGFQARYDLRQDRVVGHVNVLFASGGSTYQVRSPSIDSIRTAGRRTATFVAYGTLSDVSDPSDPVLLEEGLRVVVSVVDGRPRNDQVSIAVYRGARLVAASGWDSGPVSQRLSAGRIVVR